MSTDSVHVILDETSVAAQSRVNVILNPASDVLAEAEAACPYWLRVDGQEIANTRRLSRYVENVGVDGFRIVDPDADCWILDQPDGAFIPYDTPWDDPAPWYDQFRPESAAFLGCLMHQLDVHPVSYREPTQRQTRRGGSVIGAQKIKGRQADVGLTLVAANHAGLAYGYEWVTNTLSGGACRDCIGSTVEFRLSCPPSAGGYNDLGYWLMYDVGVTSGPDPLALEEGFAIGTTTFTLEAGRPELYKPQLTCADLTQLTPTDPSGACINFDDWWCGNPGTGIACCTIHPPQFGAVGAVVTVRAPSGVGPISIASYSNCPPDPTVDKPIASMQINSLPPQSELVIDSAQRKVTYTGSDAVPVNGSQYITVTPGSPMAWVDIADCDASACLCVTTDTPCAGGQDVMVSVNTQLRVL